MITTPIATKTSTMAAMLTITHTKRTRTTTTKAIAGRRRISTYRRTLRSPV